VSAPAGTPVAVLDKVNADLHKVMSTPEVEQRLTGLGMPPAPTSRDEFDKFIRSEIARWAEVIRVANVPKQ
jgi:tripartite-type tricarboxylate transporter receptor subunit TctC